MEKQEEMKEVVFCVHCGKPEYWGKMRWLSGWQVCRNCYKKLWEQEHSSLYTWTDLDGPRPTVVDYEKQQSDS